MHDCSVLFVGIHLFCHIHIYHVCFVSDCVIYIWSQTSSILDLDSQGKILPHSGALNGNLLYKFRF